MNKVNCPKTIKSIENKVKLDFKISIALTCVTTNPSLHYEYSLYYRIEPII